jgi:hypothetical protein
MISASPLVWTSNFALEVAWNLEDSGRCPIQQRVIEALSWFGCGVPWGSLSQLRPYLRLPNIMLT